MDALFDDSECLPEKISILEVYRLFRISEEDLKDLIFTLEPKTLTVDDDFEMPYVLFDIICAVCRHDGLERKHR